MVVIFLLISSLMIVTGIKSTLTARKWKQMSPQLDGPDPDIKVLQYFGIGTVMFLASIFFATCVISPKFLGSTSVIAEYVSAGLACLGLLGFLGGFLVASNSITVVGVELLLRNFFRR